MKIRIGLRNSKKNDGLTHNKQKIEETNTEMISRKRIIVYIYIDLHTNL
jgi:hypothetical protein